MPADAAKPALEQLGYGLYVIASRNGDVNGMTANWLTQVSFEPRMVALVCHPHPQFGGTLHNKVVFRAAKAATGLGLAALRFNFRGVGQSEGEYSEGAGERDDVRAALDYLLTRFAEKPVCLMGFSFGAWVGLAVGARDPRVKSLVGLGLPTASEDLAFLRQATKPKLIVQGTQDVYGPRNQVEALFASLPEPKRIHWVEGADHFFSGKLDEVQAAVRVFLEQTLAAVAPTVPDG